MTATATSARARSRSAEPAADATPGFTATLVHGRLYHVVGIDGAPDRIFEQGKPVRVDEETAHRLAAAADRVTRGHKTDDEGLYSAERAKFLVTGPGGASIVPDGIEPPAAREVARLGAGGKAG